MSYPFLALQPTGLSAADEWVRMGFESHQAGNTSRAESQYKKALALEPNHPVATNNLALAYAMAGEVHEAVIAAERAVLFAPDHCVIRANYAFMLMAADQPLTALIEARKALALAPVHPNTSDDLERAGYILARQALATAYSSTGRCEEAAPLHAEALSLNATNMGSGIGLCFLSSLRDVGPEQALPPRAAWRASHGYKGTLYPHNNDPDPDRPLRVGYVSGDFKTHSAALIFSHVLTNHDTTQVVPYFYSTVPAIPVNDLYTMIFMETVGRAKEDPDGGIPIKIEEGHRWRDIYGLSDADADLLIRQDKIDVLVDLSGHTQGNRLPLFTRKPAPVQVTAWGFALGTGLPEIDAFLADPVTVPADERQHFVERVIYLPCIVTYRPPVEYGLASQSTPPPCLRNDFVTFGCFGRFEKMSDAYLRTVREVLNRVPNSRAFFKDAGFKRPDHIRRVRQALDGIDHSRLLFGMGTSHIDHLQAYPQVDLFLDTFPHGMGQTALECLYMGVPAVTLYGKGIAGRLAASILTVMNRTEWITKTVPEYIDKAVAMAGDAEMLKAVRKTLRTELVDSPVVKGYPQAVESAYRMLWRQWCAKQAPPAPKIEVTIADVAENGHADGVDWSEVKQEA